MNNRLKYLQEARNEIAEALLDLDRLISRVSQISFEIKGNQQDILIEFLLDELQISKTELTSKSRVAEIMEKRNIIIYILRNVSNQTAVQISKFVDKDHSTVMFALKSIQNRIDTEGHFREKVQDLVRRTNDMYAMPSRPL